MIATDLSKKQALDADPKPRQHNNFTVNLDWAENTFFFIIEEAKEKILDFHKELLKYCECRRTT